jgi:hypothetical protein
MRPRVPRTKTMRVATALTGMTACAAAFGPAATAQAATQAHQPATPELKIVKLGPVGTAKNGLRVHAIGQAAGQITPDGSKPNLDFSLGMTIGGVSQVRVCGYHPGGVWRCTSEMPLNKDYSYLIYNIGGNVRSWQRGATDVYWDKGGAGSWDTCNTNGAYNGLAGYLYNSNDSLRAHYSLNYVWLTTVGPGDPTC